MISLLLHELTFFLSKLLIERLNVYSMIWQGNLILVGRTDKKLGKNAQRWKATSHFRFGPLQKCPVVTKQMPIVFLTCFLGTYLALLELASWDLLRFFRILVIMSTTMPQNTKQNYKRTENFIYSTKKDKPKYSRFEWFSYLFRSHSQHVAHLLGTAN